MRTKKKGKFTMGSCITSDDIIFYQSKSRDKKIEAFTIIETKNLELLIKILNRLLQERHINYYSLQINVPLKEKYLFLLNFEDYIKDNIHSRLSHIKSELNKNNVEFHFLVNKTLENIFFKVIIDKLKPTIVVSDSNSSILITECHKNGSSSSKRSKNEEIITYLNFYEINCFRIEKQNYFLNNLLEFFNNLNVMGNIIFHFYVNYQSKTKFSCYFVNRSQNKEFELNMEEEINNLFKAPVINKIKLSKKKLFRILWRLSISDRLFSYETYSEIFYSKKQYVFDDIVKFSNQLEQNLVRNQIDYRRLNENLILIRDSILFYYSNQLDVDQVSQLIEEYYPELHIYLLPLNDIDYNRINMLEKLKELTGLKILNKDEFLELNMEDLEKSILNHELF